MMAYGDPRWCVVGSSSFDVSIFLIFLIFLIYYFPDDFLVGFESSGIVHVFVILSPESPFCAHWSG